MKSPSIESNDVDADVVVGEEIGARKADTPIYNALKPSMRMIHMRHARRATYPRQTRPANRSTSFEPMSSGYWNVNKNPRKRSESRVSLSEIRRLEINLRNESVSPGEPEEL